MFALRLNDDLLFILEGEGYGIFSVSDGKRKVEGYVGRGGGDFTVDVDIRICNFYKGYEEEGL